MSNFKSSCASRIFGVFASKKFPSLIQNIINKMYVKLMKVDIEGYELFALKGGENLLKENRIKNIIVEMHPIQLEKLGQSIGEIENLLTQYGYKNVDGVFTCEL